MDNLQYISTDDYLNDDKLERFKPYYKWITFNTVIAVNHNLGVIDVLNLIING